MLLMSVIWNANKKGNSENLLDAALFDQDFYERVKAAGGWLYQMDESTAEPFKISTAIGPTGMDRERTA
jgi:hypothetical protein